MAGIDSSVKLLLHFDNNVTDSSASAHTVTSSNITFSSTVYKFGGYSAVFNGSTGYMEIADSVDWSFGTGDFTIDGWFYASTTAGTLTILKQKVDGNNTWTMIKNSAHKLLMTFYIGGVDKGTYSVATEVFPQGAWTHVAFCRSGSTGKIYMAGVSRTLTETTAFGANDVGNIAANLGIGVDLSDGSDKWNGYIDELRISKGVCRYSADFSPPAYPYATRQISKINGHPYANTSKFMGVPTGSTAKIAGLFQ